MQGAEPFVDWNADLFRLIGVVLTLAGVAVLAGRAAETSVPAFRGREGAVAVLLGLALAMAYRNPAVRTATVYVAGAMAVLVPLAVWARAFRAVLDVEE